MEVTFNARWTLFTLAYMSPLPLVYSQYTVSYAATFLFSALGCVGK